LRKVSIVPDSFSPNDKITLITGATSGIGQAAAQAIAAQGGRVVIAGRNAAKTEAVAAELRQASGNPAIDYLLADLSSLAEVRRLAAEFTTRYDRLDVLVNNAGAFFMRRQETVDGLEMTFALNHLSYFLLTTLLLDTLETSAPARVINVASAAESGAKVDWDDLQLRRRYRGFEAYALSKRFNLYFTYELARRLAGTGVTVNAVHPGSVATGIWANPFGRLGGLAKPVTKLMMRSPEQGAGTVVYLATSPEVDGVTGKYFYDRQARYSSRASQDPDDAQRAWQISAALCGLAPDD
jgi:NAD(P)-dependent dehydrogenase (short-subunit alcohol dehydrogenase family)